MPIVDPTPDFTDRDFDSTRLRLQALIRARIPAWTDFSTANFGNVLVELLCHVSDVLHHAIDGAALEAFVEKATQRGSLIKIGRLVGYRMKTASAAVATERFALTAVHGANVTIPAGTIVRTNDAARVRFRLLEAVTISAGANPPQVEAEVEHSTAHELLLPASGLPNFDLLLDPTPYLDDGSIAVESSNEGDWTEVRSLLSSGPLDRHYQVLVDQKDRATLRFGNGVKGRIPTGTLTIAMKTGGGPEGNVDAGSLTVLEGTIADATGRTVRVLVTNPEKASGGAPRETPEEAKLGIPEAVRATSRSITRDDFEINARAVSGVARALMVTSNEDGTVDENAGILYVVPEGGGEASDELLADVLTMVRVTRPPTATFQIDALTAPYKTLDFEIRAYFSASPATVKARILAALEAFFAVSLEDGTPNPTIGFGFEKNFEVAWSDLFNAVRDVSGVRKIEPLNFRINGSAESVALLVRQFPILGEVVVIDAATGVAV